MYIVLVSCEISKSIVSLTGGYFWWQVVDILITLSNYFFVFFSVMLPSIYCVVCFGSILSFKCPFASNLSKTSNLICFLTKLQTRKCLLAKIGRSMTLNNCLRTNGVNMLADFHYWCSYGLESACNCFCDPWRNVAQQ